MKRLGDITEIFSGYTFRERLDAYPGGDVAVVQMKNIDMEDRLQTNEIARVEIDGLRALQQLREGDLIFRSRGMFHTAALVNKNLGYAVAAAPLMIIRTTSTSVLPEYLQWFINHPATQARLATLAAGTHVRTVNKTAIEEIEVPVPALEKQRRIAELAELGRSERALATRIAEQKARVLEEILSQIARNTR